MALLTRGGLLDIAEELLATINADHDHDVEVRPERIVNHAHVPTVFGLRQHVLRLGAVVVDLYRRDLTVESMSLIRQMFECAVTAGWVANSREAAPALANEELRQRKNMAEQLRTSATQVFRDAADSIAHLDEPVFISSANDQGRAFKARCEALQGGHDAYVIYRALSSYCHASVGVVGQYLIVEDGDAAPVLRMEPEPIDHDAWLHLAVASVIWAARALDVLDRDHPQRSYLRAMARKIGAHDVLELTEKAKAEEARAATARRRAARLPPRRRRPTR